MTSNNFPTLHGRRITNIHQFKKALVAASADLVAGRISLKQANAINREARAILKMVFAAISGNSAEAHSLRRLTPKQKNAPAGKARGKGTKKHASITTAKSILQS